MMQYIDTHTHIDGEEFNDDRAETIARAKAAGVSRMFVPAIDLKSVDTVLSVCRENEGYAGRLNHHARQNHRIIPVTIHQEDWCLQYSP